VFLGIANLVPDRKARSNPSAAAHPHPEPTGSRASNRAAQLGLPLLALKMIRRREDALLLIVERDRIRMPRRQPSRDGRVSSEGHAVNRTGQLCHKCSGCGLTALSPSFARLASSVEGIGPSSSLDRKQPSELALLCFPLPLQPCSTTL
jgi:hypothetical protein